MCALWRSERWLCLIVGVVWLGSEMERGSGRSGQRTSGCHIDRIRVGVRSVRTLLRHLSHRSGVGRWERWRVRLIRRTLLASHGSLHLLLMRWWLLLIHLWLRVTLWWWRVLPRLRLLLWLIRLTARSGQRLTVCAVQLLALWCSSVASPDGMCWHECLSLSRDGSENAFL